MLFISFTEATIELRPCVTPLCNDEPESLILVLDDPMASLHSGSADVRRWMLLLEPLTWSHLQGDRV